MQPRNTIQSLFFMAFSGLHQHATLRAFDQFEAGEIVLGLGDHAADDAVAVVARLDAVNLAAELVLVGAEIL